MYAIYLSGEMLGSHGEEHDSEWATSLLWRNDLFVHLDFPLWVNSVWNSSWKLSPCFSSSFHTIFIYPCFLSIFANLKSSFSYFALMLRKESLLCYWRIHSSLKLVGCCWDPGITPSETTIVLTMPIHSAYLRGICLPVVLNTFQLDIGYNIMSPSLTILIVDFGFMHCF